MKKIFIIIFVLLACAAGAATVFPLSEQSGIYVKYSHKVHVVGQGIDCETCHETVRTNTFATIPGISKCLECHESKITESSEEQKIRDAAAKGEKLSWKRVFRLPSHVYFSHRRHVGVAGIDCVKCHGEVWKMTAPLTAPLRTLVMEDCIDCHKERHAAWDCIDCHR